jgi:hypothetical protein
MAILTIRYDIPGPQFVHSFVYVGEKKERAALKEAEQEVAAKAGSDTEKWFRSVVARAPELLPGAAPAIRQGLERAITAWALDLSAGHPTRQGTIDEFLNDSDFLVTITKVTDGKISVEVYATPGSAGSA